MEPNGLCPGEKTVIRFVPSDSVGGGGVMISSDSDRVQRSLQAIRAVRVSQIPKHTFR